MGCFPYDCNSCGGGYQRCGAGHCTDDKCDGGPCEKLGEHEPCAGGQFCWEDAAVVKVAENQPYYQGSTLQPGAIVRGQYDSYGRVFSDNQDDKKIYISNEFSGYVEGWYKGRNAESLKLVVMCSGIWCASCYDPLLGEGKVEDETIASSAPLPAAATEKKTSSENSDEMKDADSEKKTKKKTVIPLPTLCSYSVKGYDQPFVFGLRTVERAPAGQLNAGERVAGQTDFCD